MKKRDIILIIILLVLVSGCANRATNQGPGNTDNYRTGTRGLEISFPTGLPDQIYENDRNVKMVVEIRNEGAFPQIDEEREFDAYLWVGGYDPDIIDISPDNGIRLDERELEGKSTYNDEGGYSAEEFNANVYDLPSGASIYKPTLIFTATYFYKTIASPIICIDPEPRSTYVRDKVCTVQENQGLSSQGAPITVKRIEQHVTSENFQFKIEIQNSGGGMVIQKSDVDNNPNAGYDWRDLNEIRIDDISVGEQRMSSCRPDIGDTVELIDGNGYIFCRLDKSIVGDRVYTTPLNIELSYGYSSSVTKGIEIFEEIGY